MGFTFEANDDGFGATLAKVAGLGSRDYRTPFRRIANAWLKEIDSSFVNEADPFGNPWHPLAKSTIDEKQRKGVSNPTAILQETGELRQSWKADITRVGFTIFSDRVFDDGSTAEIHQFGGVAARSNATIPARPMLPEDEFPPLWQDLAIGFLGDDLDAFLE